MNSYWRKSADNDQELEELQKILANGHFLLDKLDQICYNIIIESEKTSVSDYDNPSWSHKQAHLNGKREALELIRQLISKKD